MKTKNGKKVIDAKEDVSITIRPIDTKVGGRKRPGGCIVAKVAERSPKCLKAEVYRGRVYLERPTHWDRYMTGDPLRTEIIAFDRGGRFEPGRYKIKAPSGSETVEARRRAHVVKRTARVDDRPSKARNPRKVHVVGGIRPRAA